MSARAVGLLGELREQGCRVAEEGLRAAEEALAAAEERLRVAQLELAEARRALEELEGDLRGAGPVRGVELAGLGLERGRRERREATCACAFARARGARAEAGRALEEAREALRLALAEAKVVERHGAHLQREAARAGAAAEELEAELASSSSPSLGAPSGASRKI